MIQLVVELGEGQGWRVGTFVNHQKKGLELGRAILDHSFGLGEFRPSAQRPVAILSASPSAPSGFDLKSILAYVGLLLRRSCVLYTPRSMLRRQRAPHAGQRETTHGLESYVRQVLDCTRARARPVLQRRSHENNSVTNVPGHPHRPHPEKRKEPGADRDQMNMSTYARLDMRARATYIRAGWPCDAYVCMLAVDLLQSRTRPRVGARPQLPSFSNARTPKTALINRFGPDCSKARRLMGDRYMTVTAACAGLRRVPASNEPDKRHSRGQVDSLEIMTRRQLSRYGCRQDVFAQIKHAPRPGLVESFGRHSQIKA